MPREASFGAVGDMLDDLKSRLGFSRGDDAYDDDYDDFGEYSYDEYGDYDDADQQVGGYRPATTRSGRFGRSDSSPNLVSIGDVRATTPLPDRKATAQSAMTDDGMTQTSVGGHYVIDATAPAPSSPAYKAAQREAQQRIEGFAPVTAPDVPAGAVSARQFGKSSASVAAYDPYEAYTGAVPSAHAPARKLTVVQPVVYGDVERVARAVKSGDVVVLSMRTTPDELAKRILDFSFGVASALDASVECPASKVFAIARGTALTDDEKKRLKAQSIL